MKTYLSDPYGRIVELRVRNGKANFIFWQEKGLTICWKNLMVKAWRFRY